MPEFVILNDRYQLLERLGSGGMAMVYRARDLTLERTVAIKILRRDYSGDPAFRRRFHQEAKAAANLSHPNIVTIHDFGLFADQLFIVMEYVPGMDLKTWMKQHGQVSIPEAIQLINQACAGIGHAHRAGLVHCDVKPQNMLVSPDGRLKVLDFGIARALATISPDEKSDVVWGSPQYFSPEQAAGFAPSPASDVYSLGVVLYEMVCGRLPFIANTAEQLADLHQEALPPSPRKFNPAIPLTLEQIILKVLAKEPAARYRTADQLGQVLDTYKQAPPPVYPPAQNPGTYPNPGHSRPLPTIPPRQAYPAVNTAGYSEDAYENTYEGYEEAYEDEYDGEAVENELTPDLLIVTSPIRNQGFDWLTWLLALLALIALGGLIPFWLWVMYMIRPSL
jgi:eukaryotic-like serine/threonine-protein kinase